MTVKGYSSFPKLQDSGTAAPSPSAVGRHGTGIKSTFFVTVSEVPVHFRKCFRTIVSLFRFFRSVSKHLFFYL